MAAKTSPKPATVRLALPKGRMQEGIFKLLADAGVPVKTGSREYRPTVPLPGFEVKLLKPQNIVEMLHHGSRDVGFAGADWVEEKNARLVELLDTGLDPVSIVAAAPTELLKGGKLPRRHLVIATEYERLTSQWIRKSKLDASIVRTYGATEVFPPEDADMIVDNTATGSTLKANGLEIVDTLKRSSTRLYANPAAMEDKGKRAELERLVLLLSSVLDARKRVMLEVNVALDRLEEVCKVLPCMREPTISALHGGAGYAVKAAVPRADLPDLIPRIRASGGTDIIVSSLTQIVP